MVSAVKRFHEQSLPQDVEFMGKGALEAVKLLSEYIQMNLWLAAVSIVLFAYDGSIKAAEGSILLFLDLVCIIHLSKITNFLFGVEE